MVLTLPPLEVESLDSENLGPIIQSQDEQLILTALNSFLTYVRRRKVLLETAGCKRICTYRVNSNVTAPLGVQRIVGTELTLDVHRCCEIAWGPDGVTEVGMVSVVLACKLFIQHDRLFRIKVINSPSTGPTTSERASAVTL